MIETLEKLKQLLDEHERLTGCPMKDLSGNPVHTGPGVEVKWDEFDTDWFQDEFGKLAEPIQALLIFYTQIKATEDSFGANAERLAKGIIPLLRNLHSACKEKFEEDL